MPRIVVTAVLSFTCAASLSAQVSQPSALLRPEPAGTPAREALVLDSTRDSQRDPDRATWLWIAVGGGAGAVIGGVATHFFAQIACDSVDVPCNADARKRSAVAFGAGFVGATGAAVGAAARWIHNRRPKQ